MEDAAAAAEPPEAENRSTAAIEPDERSEESDSSEHDDWEWLRQNDMFFEGLYYPHRDSAQPDERRARREAVERKRAEWEASPEGIALNAEVDALLAKSYAAHGWSSNVGPHTASDVRFSSPWRGGSRVAGPGGPQVSRRDSNPPPTRACARNLCPPTRTRPLHHTLTQRRPSHRKGHKTLLSTPTTPTCF